MGDKGVGRILKKLKNWLWSVSILNVCECSKFAQFEIDFIISTLSHIHWFFSASHKKVIFCGHLPC